MHPPPPLNIDHIILYLLLNNTEYIIVALKTVFCAFSKVSVVVSQVDSMPYNRKQNVLSVLLNKTFLPSGKHYFISLIVQIFSFCQDKWKALYLFKSLFHLFSSSDLQFR